MERKDIARMARGSFGVPDGPRGDGTSFERGLQVDGRPGDSQGAVLAPLLASGAHRGTPRMTVMVDIPA